MNKILQRALMAYRPMYLHGVWLDGRRDLPEAEPTDASGAPRVRQRTLLVPLNHIAFQPRSK
jgi:hypothetical protein